jgi:hypothetical protein
MGMIKHERGGAKQRRVVEQLAGDNPAGGGELHPGVPLERRL